jgi:hypothetical protein
MAPKEDMLPPGWDDLDRYAAIQFPLRRAVSIIGSAPPPLAEVTTDCSFSVPFDLSLQSFPFYPFQP